MKIPKEMLRNDKEISDIVCHYADMAASLEERSKVGWQCDFCARWYLEPSLEDIPIDRMCYMCEERKTLPLLMKHMRKDRRKENNMNYIKISELSAHKVKELKEGFGLDATKDVLVCLAQYEWDSIRLLRANSGKIKNGTNVNWSWNSRGVSTELQGVVVAFIGRGKDPFRIYPLLGNIRKGLMPFKRITTTNRYLVSNYDRWYAPPAKFLERCNEDKITTYRVDPELTAITLSYLGDGE